MFNKVIWATDGSEHADRALVFARALAAEPGGELLAVHCIELTLPGKGPGGRYPIHANEKELQEKVKLQVAKLLQEGVRASLQIERTDVGGSGHVIADVARKVQADLIVVGTRGRTALAGLLLGSVTQRLLHIAHCPVLAVPAPDGTPSRTESQ